MCRGYRSRNQSSLHSFNRQTLESESVCPYAWSLESGFVGFEVIHGEPAPILQVEFTWLHWTHKGDKDSLGETME
jgi:hypothetical protein